MTATPLTLDDLEHALAAAEARVTGRHDDALTVAVLLGPRARTARIELAPTAALIDACDGDRRAALGSFARGVTAALSEPTTVADPPDTFGTAARSLLPTIEGPLFAAGVEATGAAAPYLHAFAANLAVAYTIELDEGFRVLTAEQVSAWEVTHDRVHKASLSILFHRTSFGAFEDAGDGVQRFRMGDGYDAARALIFDMWDYHRARAGVAFCLPSPGEMLLTDDTSDEGVARLTALAAKRFDEAGTPLSLTVFRFVDGKLVV